MDSNFANRPEKQGSLANENPDVADQARLPAGGAGGGRWTKEGFAGPRPSSPILSGGNNWTPPAPQPPAKVGLTHEDRARLRKQNAWAADIIAKFGDKGEAPETEQSILDGRLKSSRTTNQGWMPGTQKWDLKHQYPGFSDGDIALLESTRRNVARAKAAMAQAGKLSKSQVTALQLRGMGVLADATMNLALALAPYGSASALVTRSLAGGAASVIDAGVSEAVGSAAGEASETETPHRGQSDSHWWQSARGRS